MVTRQWGVHSTPGLRVVSNGSKRAGENFSRPFLEREVKDV